MKQTSWKTRVALVALGVALGGASTALAQSSDAILDLLIKKGVISQREANEVREQLDKDTAAAVELHNKQKFASWVDELKWAGDLRLRGEFFDMGDQKNENDRLRFRYRLRLGLEAKLQKWATLGVRLASGKAGDPVSTNETMDDLFDKDVIQIDAAYVVLQPPGWEWVSVTGGKMNNPIWQTGLSSPLVYDGDLTPEGLAEQFVLGFGGEKRHAVFLNLAQWVADEVGSSADTDAFVFDTQAGVELRFGPEVKKPVVRARAAGGVFFTEHMDENGLTGDSPTTGNSVQASATSKYLDDFTVAHARAEVAWQVAEKPFLGTPVVFTVSGEYVKNLTRTYDRLAGAKVTVDARQTDGVAGQLAFGGNKKKGEWQVAYQYKYLEADAVLDALTDSDWGTDGGTDRKGHVFKASYNLQEWWQLGFTALLTQKISDRTGANTTAGGIPTDKDVLLRWQLDSVFKF
jgi:hypothetical protein